MEQCGWMSLTGNTGTLEITILVSRCRTCSTVFTLISRAIVEGNNRTVYLSQSGTNHEADVVRDD